MKTAALLSSRDSSGSIKFSSFPPYGSITSDLGLDNDWLDVITDLLAPGDSPR
ncbi:hypothetical protein EV06_0547 [Prochlorococcus sp. MIT 0602]|nr:hypothetical protein EV06_0547 [Prochlorococcus sp. MIT 0602]KGG18323.1 hypothetical protein EV07_0239 [Prochlorococcus sp. MIT 0603]